MSQNQPGSGSFSGYTLSPDWSNTVIAVLAFIFSVFTYINQKNKDRKTSADQQEREIQAAYDAERLRQQTVRLEWYREAIRARLEVSYRTFDTLHTLGQELDNSSLDDTALDAFIKPYKRHIFELRDDALEPILFIHNRTYNTLKNQLDQLIEETTALLYEQEDPIVRGIYSRDLSNKIKNCQQQFFTTIYSYRGEE